MSFTMELLVSRAQAQKIGTIGGMGVYVSTRNIPEWPEGAIGLILSLEPFKIFPQDMEWIRNPNGHDKRDMIKMASPLWFDWQHHVKAQQLLLREQIKGPLWNYLFISHLFKDGFSLVKHISWASYLMNRIGEMIESPNVMNKLLATKKYETDDIYD